MLVSFELVALPWIEAADGAADAVLGFKLKTFMMSPDCSIESFGTSGVCRALRSRRGR
jgi:hypothetical protein